MEVTTRDWVPVARRCSSSWLATMPVTVSVSAAVPAPQQ